MKSIKFLGAAGMVTGSGYIVTPNTGKQVLVDLGMFQGPEEISVNNLKPLELNVESIEAAFLTHAHLDHCGRLPLLAKAGFKGFVYMTEATRELAELVIMDSAKIQEMDDDEPLYTKKDAIRILNHFKSINYGEEVKTRSFTARFRDAGHIIGSSIIELTENESGEKIVFSGDLGNTPQDIERPTETIQKADYIVMETTYGDKNHKEEHTAEVLAREINEVEKSGGALLIPSFSIERTQVLLHLIKHLKSDNKVDNQTPVYLDSPMAQHATRIYRKYKNLYNQDLKEHSRNGDPFNFPGLTTIKSHKQSESMRETKGAKVIIAGSGMMTGGRILSHSTKYLPDAKSRLLIVGYQAVETIGREILEGAKEVRIDDGIVPVNASVTDISGLSAHAGQEQLTNWITKVQGVKKIFLTHGDEPQRKEFANLVKEKTNIKEIFTPALNEELPLNG